MVLRQRTFRWFQFQVSLAEDVKQFSGGVPGVSAGPCRKQLYRRGKQGRFHSSGQPARYPLGAGTLLGRCIDRSASGEAEGSSVADKGSFISVCRVYEDLVVQTVFDHTAEANVTYELATQQGGSH